MAVALTSTDHTVYSLFYIWLEILLSPQLFHKILGVAFSLLPCPAQGKPAGIPSLLSFMHLPEDGTDQIFATNGKKADFHTTLKKCKEAGGSIATPRNPGKNDAILYFVKSFNTYTYLGIKESLILSKFQFLDGTQLSYTNWHLNEPSGKGKEECVEMYADGTWNEKGRNQNSLIVCQF
ncbi:LOW QUALITY PROTEIN: pulmonary surfactant-associated protein A-like [Gymnogyps californianus]|uniref:LOW QUALITY PROTEIN: pulmonary surfactant-associated protein A-like n=1 Tax=Gymnogyps californianus TaxID=33616 RepID=UPI0021C72CEB|nr:LOW QUALITY PROTEIN: pulmonary surfactant-associated protein A-like [Gymnogyps californianus]